MYDVQQLRELATLAGVSVPESDETLMNYLGSTLASVSRQFEGLIQQIQQVTLERDETKKNHGYSCHVCGALRTECEIMKRTADDTRIEVATRCIEIAHQSGATDTVSRKKIAELIREQFLSD